MKTKATSTIAALRYNGSTDLDFEGLVTEFNEALGGSAVTRTTMPDSGGHFVTFSTDAARICLAYVTPDLDAGNSIGNSIGNSTSASACTNFVLSVGTCDDTVGLGPIFDQRWQLCGDLIGRIEELYPSDHNMWIEVDEVFTRDVCDRFVASLWTDKDNALKFSTAMWPNLEPDTILPDLDRRLVDEFTRAGKFSDRAPERKRSTPRPRMLPIPTHTMSVQPEIKDADVASEFVAEFAAAAQEIAQEAAQEGVVETDLVVDDTEDDKPAKIVLTHPAMYADMPHRRVRAENLPAVIGPRVAIGDPDNAEGDALLFREALYPPELEEENPRDNPLAHRMAIYTMNFTLLVIATPVGAAMMTYCACGRENMNVMGRAMALTGIALGFGSTEAGAAIMPFLS